MVRIAIDINDVVRDYTRQFDKFYRKTIDPLYEIDYDDIKDVDLFTSYPFVNEFGEADRDMYNRFKYEDCPFEIFGRADLMDRNLSADLRLWLQNTMRNFDEGKNPEVLYVSTFEYGLGIQGTLSFLARIGSHVREYYFPVDSGTVWDRCDILITADPRLIDRKPEGKVAIKIAAPYNSEAKADYEFDTLSELIHDENHTINKIVEERNNADV